MLKVVLFNVNIWTTLYKGRHQCGFGILVLAFYKSNLNVILIVALFT